MPESNPAPYRISIADQQEVLPLDFGKIRRAVQLVLQAEKCSQAQISLAFVTDPAIHVLNKRYLNHDYPTDVLTFPMERGKRGLEGEIVISTDTAIANAEDYDHTPEQELLLYVIHGVLHLLDYDDQDEEDAAIMEETQEKYLAELERTANSSAAKLPYPLRPHPPGKSSGKNSRRPRS
jgi:probable rRNA maturation factor